MKIEILFRTQALLNLASAGPAACLFLIVGPGWSCRWRLCRSDRTLNTLTLEKIENFRNFSPSKHVDVSTLRDQTKSSPTKYADHSLIFL